MKGFIISHCKNAHYGFLSTTWPARALPNQTTLQKHLAALTQPSQKLKPSSSVREPQAPSAHSLIPASPKENSRAEAGNPSRKQCPGLSWGSAQAVLEKCSPAVDADRTLWREPHHSSWQFISAIKVSYPSIKLCHPLWTPAEDWVLCIWCLCRGAGRGGCGAASVRRGRGCPALDVASSRLFQRAPTDPPHNTAEPLSQDGGTSGECIWEKGKHVL